MGYLNEPGLARYDQLIKNWVTFKSGTVDGVDPLLNWQRTETAEAVTFYPLPAAPIDPVVNFSFTETGPASGEKGSDNPSTITGVSSVTVTRCETTGIDSTDYTIDLNGIYYGGSLDVTTGVMTVTSAGIALDGTEDWYNFREQTDATGTYRAQVVLQNSGKSADAGFACSHYTSMHSISANAAGPGIYVSAFGDFVLFTNYTTLSDLTSWLASQNLNGTPVTAAWNIAAPYIVQLTPQQIYSLSQPDPYVPRINTVYSDQVSVQVGYPKSPQASQNELTSAIVSLGGNV